MFPSCGAETQEYHKQFVRLAELKKLIKTKCDKVKWKEQINRNTGIYTLKK